MAILAICRMSSALSVDPVGLWGELKTINRVRSVTRLSTSATSIRNSFASRRGAGTAVPATYRAMLS